MEIVLDMTGRQPPGEHLEEGEIARLAEGRADEAQRARLMGHLVNCPSCYEELQYTLSELAGEKKANSRGWLNRNIHAVAASLLLVVLVGGGLYYSHHLPGSGGLTASLGMDQSLETVLAESPDTQWERGPRTARLESLLNERGVKTGTLTRVVLDRPYLVTRGLAKKERLKITLRDGVAYLEVQESEPEPTHSR
jgi:hypothetical protein